MKNGAWFKAMETVALYMRLSSEDAHEGESCSIGNQRDLLYDFIGKRRDFDECNIVEFSDDGYPGSTFERPSFQKMMEEVKAGKINCIVVKDLSRFGRNYLDAGEYIEKIFPFLGVRFIAVNDNYDSSDRNVELDSLMIPFKNLINEAYCRDISIKIRSQLEIKRKRGDFTGSFAVYGYRKSLEDKNRLEADDFAAEVVRDIFRWKLEGISAGDIADRLNNDGILSPLAYKKAHGLRFVTPFCADASCLWSAAAILRILKNPVYTGTLIQGKTTTPSYKVKKRIEKPSSEWAVVEDAHEAIIDREEFDAVQKVLGMDTRTSPGGRAVEVFSGMVFCGECGAPMVRKTVPSGKRKYIYYVCGAHKNEKLCYSHSLPDAMLKEIVLVSLQKQIQSFLDKSAASSLAESVFLGKSDIKKHKKFLVEKEEETKRYQRLLDSLYENLADGIIDGKEYGELKRNYEMLLMGAKKKAGEIHAKISRREEEDRAKIDGMAAEESKGEDFAGKFEKEWKMTEVDRAMAVFLIDKIFVFRNKKVEIVYNWRDEWKGAPMHGENEAKS